jgi:hypothetical protein
MRFLRVEIVAVMVAALTVAAPAPSQTYRSHIEHPIVNYRMSARLYPELKTVKGRYQLTWWNHTGDSIPDLYFHLYLNAFKNADSTFIRESDVSRRGVRLKDFESANDNWGWEDVDRILVNGADLTRSQVFVQPDDDNAMDETVMRVPLPQPIAPHGTAELSVEFTSRMPKALARSGYEGDYYLMAQWFPKIGVYEGAGERGRKTGGWNCHQYHANTEFYADRALKLRPRLNRIPAGRAA